MSRIKYGLALLLLALLSACGSTSATPTPSATPPAATTTPPSVTLQFWTVLPDKGVTEQSLGQLILAFQKENPTIAINVASAPTYTELYRKVVASIATGTLPDLVTAPDADIAQYAQLKALVALDEYANDGAGGLSRSVLNDIPPSLLETTRLPNQSQTLYSLPFARSVYALYYNWSAMKAIGITNTPRTWDEFRLHARSLSKNPVRGFAYHADATVFQALLLSRDGSLYNAERTKALFNSAAGVDALAYLSEGVKENWIYRVDGTSDMSDFASGRTIFTLDSTAAIPAYQSAINDAVKKGGKDFEWGVALLPQNNPQKPSALLVGSNLVMMKSAPVRQQAAWLFVKWLMREPVAANWTQLSGVLPIRQAARDLLGEHYVKVPQQKQAVQELMPVARAEPNVAPAPEIRELIEGALSSVEQGRASPKAALDDAAAKATILLNEKK